MPRLGLPPCPMGELREQGRRVGRAVRLDRLALERCDPALVVALVDRYQGDGTSVASRAQDVGGSVEEPSGAPDVSPPLQEE